MLITAKRKLAGRLEVMRAYIHFHCDFVVNGNGGSSVFDANGELKMEGNAAGSSSSGTSTSNSGTTSTSSSGSSTPAPGTPTAGAGGGPLSSISGLKRRSLTLQRKLSMSSPGPGGPGGKLASGQALEVLSTATAKSPDFNVDVKHHRRWALCQVRVVVPNSHSHDSRQLSLLVLPMLLFNVSRCMRAQREAELMQMDMDLQDGHPKVLL